MNIFQLLSIPKKSASLLQQIWIQCISHIPWNVLLFFCTLNRSLRWSLVGASVKQRSWDISDLGCCFTAIFTSRRFLRPVPVPLRAYRHHSALISLLSHVHMMTWQTLFGSVCPMPQPNVGNTHSWNILIYVWFFSWLKNVTMASLFFSMFHHEKHTCFTCAKCVGGTSASTTSVNRLWGSIRGDLGDLGGQLQRGQYWVARNFPTPLETSENISWNMLQTCFKL